MTTFPDLSIPMRDDAEAIELVRAAVARRAPFSMVRLGDGEGVAMSIGESSWLQDIMYLHGHWGTELVSLGDVLEVRDDLHEAVRGADLVGIRPDVVGVATPDDLLARTPGEIRAHVRDTFHLRDSERDELSVRGARRLAIFHDQMARFEWGPEQAFCSPWLHWELLADGTLADLLDGVDEVGLVTAKAGLPALVRAQFGVEVHAVTVPDKFVDTRVAGAHVPRRRAEIRSELAFRPGTLVLVGAGIPGKAYCQWVKEAGGVALDVGSVLDAWVGQASRPQVLRTRFGVAGGDHVPDELRLRRPAGSDASSRRLTPRWKPTTTAPEPA